MNIPLREYWRLLSRYLLAQRGAALSMAVLLLASTGFGLAAPQVVRAFIDAALAGAPSPLLIRTAIGFFLVSLASRALYFFAGYRVRQVGLTATNALRIDLTAHLVRLDLGFHKTHPPGELIQRVDSDVNALAEFLSGFVVGLINSILQLIGVLIAFLAEDVVLGALLSVFALLALALLAWVQRFAPPHWRAERACSASFWGSMGEMLTAYSSGGPSCSARACGGAYTWPATPPTSRALRSPGEWAARWFEPEGCRWARSI